MAAEIIYAREPDLPVAEFRAVLVASTLGQRRPIDEPQRLAAMLRQADIIVTARSQTGELVGIARSVSDFAYCCYVSDLAVAASYQHQGIGRTLLHWTQFYAGPQTRLHLIAAPAAQAYYGKIGFEPMPRCWLMPLPVPETA